MRTASVEAGEWQDDKGLSQGQQGHLADQRDSRDYLRSFSTHPLRARPAAHHAQWWVAATLRSTNPNQMCTQPPAPGEHLRLHDHSARLAVNLGVEPRIAAGAGGRWGRRDGRSAPGDWLAGGAAGMHRGRAVRPSLGRTTHAAACLCPSTDQLHLQLLNESQPLTGSG